METKRNRRKRNQTKKRREPKKNKPNCIHLLGPNLPYSTYKSNFSFRDSATSKS